MIWRKKTKDQMVPSMVDINIEHNFVDDMTKENESQTAIESEDETDFE